jgi:hypothetical protein
MVNKNEAEPPNGPLGLRTCLYLGYFFFSFHFSVSREVACQVARTYLLATWLVAGSDLMDGKRGPRTIHPLYKLARASRGTPMIRALQHTGSYGCLPASSVGQLPLVADMVF